MQSLDPEEVRRVVQAALAEDIGSGDVTTLSTIPENATLKVVMRAREVLVAAGLPLAVEAFRQLSPEVQIESIAHDGQHAKPGDILLRVSGSARGILTAERVALNFAQRLSAACAVWCTRRRPPPMATAKRCPRSRIWCRVRNRPTQYRNW